MSLFDIVPERFHLASDDYDELWDAILEHPSPEKSLDGDPYQPYRATYRRKHAAFPGVGTGTLGPGATGDTGMRHEDLEAPPGQAPSVDFIPYEPGTRCSYCNINPAEVTVNGAALCLQDAEERWGIPMDQAQPEGPGEAPQPPQEPPEDEEGTDPALEPHEAMSQYQGDHFFIFHKANPKSMGGSYHHYMEAWDQDVPIAHQAPADRPLSASTEGRIGLLRWSHETGEISKVNVQPHAKRQGLATELLRRARDVASSTRGVKPPRHSKQRTNEGEQWARSLDERLPRRLVAAWRDVMEKAKRLRANHAVHLLDVPSPDSPYVFAEIKGDTALHHCFVAVKGDEQGQWSCSCPWGDYGPNGPQAEDRSEGSPYKGTPCSHVLATRWELQSRSMFGRNPYLGALHEAMPAYSGDHKFIFHPPVGNSVHMEAWDPKNYDADPEWAERNPDHRGETDDPRKIADGEIGWDSKDGHIFGVEVKPEHRRQGLATELLRRGREHAEKAGVVRPEHSDQRSKEGEAWARSLGEDLPRHWRDEIEKEGAMATDILDAWFSGRFLVEARETPQYPQTRLAPHPNIEGTPLPTQSRPGTYKRNDRATHFEDLHPDHQKVVREHFANNFKDEDGNGLTHERMVQNVKDMYHDAAQSDKMEGKYHYLDHGSKWYNKAHNQIKQWAGTYGVKPLHMAAAAAALSPSTDWDSNLTMTHYFARHLGKNREAGHEKLDLDPSKFDEKQMADWHRVPELDKNGRPPRGNPERLTHAQIADRHGLTHGRAFDDMNDREAAHALHLQKKYTHNDLKKSFGGDMVEHPTYGSSWQSADNAEKAVGMMRGTSHVDKTLSGSKVRSFFNNLWHPGKTDDVTIDSHAASMIVGAKMGASSEHLKKAMELQGAGKETLPERTSMEEEHNVNGGYAYMASALRKAHADLVASGHMKKNSTPADLQAITWKRWRDRNPGGGAIPKEEKTPSLYTPKDTHPKLSHMDDNEDHHDRFHDDDWASSLDDEADHDEADHDEDDPDDLLDPDGGPNESDPDLYTELEEDPSGDDDDSGYDKLPSDDDYTDMLTDRRKEGAMYDWTNMLRQARREVQSRQVQASMAPVRPSELPLQYLGQVPHHLSSGMDEFGFEPHMGIAIPSEQWEEQHSPGAKNPGSTAPSGFGENLDPNWLPGKDIGSSPYPDEKMLEPGPALTSPIRSPGFNSGYEVIMGAAHGQVYAQGGGGGSSYAPPQQAQYVQAPLDPQPPFPMVQAPSSQPLSGPLTPDGASGADQTLAEHQAGLEWLRPPGGAPSGQPGASPAMSREGLLAQHQADKAQLAAGAEAYLRTGSIPVPGMEVNMDTILAMSPGSLAGMEHDARSRDFTPAEQDEMVREGELEGVKASNLHMLRLEGSMYEELERQLGGDDQSQAAANAFWW